MGESPAESAAAGSSAWPAARPSSPASAPGPDGPRARSRPPAPPTARRTSTSAGTDGWIYLPPTPAIAPFHPDVLAPAPFTTYIFGFRNVTGHDRRRSGSTRRTRRSTRRRCSGSTSTTRPRPNDFKVQLTNLGLALRPDLFDAHTLHWHGFRNVIPFFDGEPTGSVSVPAGREFTYVYRPRDPGTYMYHCHVEDVEHVHMGMTGLVFVRPLAGRQHHRSTRAAKYLYNDGDGSTGFDREFAMFLSEVWAESHWADAHIQLPEWSDYRADFSLLNGRVYPDTLAPNGSIDPFNPVRRRRRRRPHRRRPGHPELQYQPHSSLVNCNAGRAGGAAVRQPRLPRAGDDAHRASGCGSSAATPPRCGAATAPTRRTRPTRSTSAPARATTCIFTAPAAAGARAPTTPTCSTTAPTRGRTTSPPAGSAGRPPRSGSTPSGVGRQQLPERLGDLSAMTTPHALRRVRATGPASRPARRPRSPSSALAGAAVVPGAAGDGRPAAARRHRLHRTRTRGGDATRPDLQPDHADRLHQPARRQHRLHVGLLERLRRRSSTPARCCASTRATPSP